MWSIDSQKMQIKTSNNRFFYVGWRLFLIFYFSINYFIYYKMLEFGFQTWSYLHHWLNFMALGTVFEDALPLRCKFYRLYKCKSAVLFFVVSLRISKPSLIITLRVSYREIALTANSVISRLDYTLLFICFWVYNFFTRIFHAYIYIYIYIYIQTVQFLRHVT